MKLDIIFGMLLTIINKKNVTANYLANKYFISVRTVYRYLSILDSNNIPITTKPGRNGGIFLTNVVNLNNIYFTKQEKEQLLHLTQNMQNQALKISIQTKLLAMW